VKRSIRVLKAGNGYIGSERITVQPPYLPRPWRGKEDIVSSAPGILLNVLHDALKSILNAYLFRRASK